LRDDLALDDVVVGFADLAEGGPGGVDAHALLDRDLQDLALLVLVDVLVVVGAEFDLFHEPFFHFIESHERLLCGKTGARAPWIRFQAPSIGLFAAWMASFAKLMGIIAVPEGEGQSSSRAISPPLRARSWVLSKDRVGSAVGSVDERRIRAKRRTTLFGSDTGDERARNP